MAKDLVCVTCHGRGVLYGGELRPSVACSNCHGSGEILLKEECPMEEKKEVVNHPAHYGGDTVYEVIKVIEAWELDKNFCLGNTVKYIARAGKKNDKKLEDLKKAAWYLNREITNVETMILAETAKESPNPEIKTGKRGTWT